ncbi:MAG TPA: hypothetical protein VI636_17010 [Candidatus Angelobacter sp.]
MAGENQPGTERPRGGAIKHYVILVLVLYLIEYSVEIIGQRFGESTFRDHMASLSQNLEAKLQQLDPFSITKDFFSRLGDPHSLRVWSFSAPFNERAHDDQILKQLIARTAIAPRPPRLDLSPAGTTPLQASEYSRALAAFDDQFTTWERQYREVASHLAEFDAAVFDDCMRGARNSGYLSGCNYVLEYSFSMRSSRTGPSLWSDILGLPDATIYAVRRAFRGGLFTKLLGLLLVVTAVLMLGKWKIAAIFLAPLAISLLGWFLLLLAHAADALLGHIFLAPAVPTVASVVGVHTYGLIRTAFGVAQHKAAHQLTEHITRA